MPRVKGDISMSLDGFIAGPDDDVDRLHEWIYGLASWRERHGLSPGEDNPDSDVMEEAFANIGAFVMGRRMFDLGEQPWGEEPPFHESVFVVTHNAREPLAKPGGTTFYFVTDGVEGALRQARSAAGNKDVSVAGGANVLNQFIQAGLLDELQVHIVPVLLGDGIRLFEDVGPQPIELERTRVIDSLAVTHLRFNLPK